MEMIGCYCFALGALISIITAQCDVDFECKLCTSFGHVQNNTMSFNAQTVKRKFEIESNEEQLLLEKQRKNSCWWLKDKSSAKVHCILFPFINMTVRVFSREQSLE